MMMRIDAYRSSVPILEREIVQLLDQLDRINGLLPNNDLDVNTEWYRYRHRNIQLFVEHPGGGSSRFKVPSRCLAIDKVVVLHGGYLHDESPCTIVLIGWEQGSESAMKGWVSHCNHVRGDIHEVTIKLTDRINPTDYIKGLLRENTSGHVLIDPKSLEGNILVLAEQEVECRLVHHYLKDTHIRLVMETNVGRTLDRLRNDPIDILMCDYGVGGRSGPELIDAIRSAGYLGVIISMKGMKTNKRTEIASDTDGLPSLIKPFSPDQLYSVLDEQMSLLVKNNPIFSEKQSEPGMIPLLAWYREQLKIMIHDLEKLIAEDCFEQARGILCTIMETSSGYGYQECSDVASKALIAMDASFSIEESSSELQRVVQMGKRLR